MPSAFVPTFANCDACGRRTLPSYDVNNTGLCHTCRNPERYRSKRGKRGEPIVRIVTGDQSWLNQAACVGHDPEIWFPAGKGDVERIMLAKAICGECPVATECLDQHIAEEDGIFGGLTAEERHRLRRHGRAERHASCGRTRGGQGVILIDHVDRRRRVVTATVTTEQAKHRLGYLIAEGWFCTCSRGKSCPQIEHVKALVPPMEEA